jgi:pantoate--beta-alanine ligase
MDKLAEAIVLGQDIDQAISNAKEFLRAAGLEPDYLEVREASSLKPVNSDDKSLVILAAAYLGKARLIDNMILSR